MKFEKGEIITFIGKNKGVRYVGLFVDGILNAANDHTKQFSDTVWYHDEPLRLANNEEKQLLFKALAEDGKYYDSETKSIKYLKDKEMKQFTKKDLKSGMWVKFRHGGTMLCLGMCTTPDKKEDIVFANATGFDVASMLNNNLICIKNDESSIDEVYYHGYVKGDVLNGIANLPLIWQRQTDASKKEKIQAEIDKMQNAIDEMQKELNDLK